LLLELLLLGKELMPLGKDVLLLSKEIEFEVSEDVAGGVIPVTIPVAVEDEGEETAFDIVAGIGLIREGITSDGGESPGGAAVTIYKNCKPRSDIP
jgi:hypothetical protein